MFKNFNKLIPCRDIIKYNNNLTNKKKEIKLNDKLNKIPISERWECRDFKIRNNSAIQSYSLIVPNDKHYKK